MQHKSNVFDTDLEILVIILKQKICFKIIREWYETSSNIS